MTFLLGAVAAILTQTLITTITQFASCAPAPLGEAPTASNAEMKLKAWKPDPRRSAPS